MHGRPGAALSLARTPELAGSEHPKNQHQDCLDQDWEKEMSGNLMKNLPRPPPGALLRLHRAILLHWMLTLAPPGELTQHSPMRTMKKRHGDEDLIKYHVIGARGNRQARALSTLQIGQGSIWVGRYVFSEWGEKRHNAVSCGSSISDGGTARLPQ